MSGHETPRSFGGMHTPGVAQCIAPETANQLLKNGKFFGGDKGVLPPATPINPYLGGWCPLTFLSFRKFSFEINFPLMAILGSNPSQVSGGLDQPPKYQKG